MSIIYIYLYMHYMLKRRVEQWLGVCECERGEGWEICRLRERAKEIESIVRVQSGENIASFTRSKYQATTL